MSIVYGYFRCRRCNNLICAPINTENETYKCISRPSEYMMSFTEDLHPKCTMSFPEHFKVITDLVFITEDTPYSEDVHNLRYEIDFTPYELTKR